MVVVDVGANIGYYTLLAATIVGPTGKVIAFEPSVSNCTLVRKSLRANEVTWAKVHPYAVADEEGVVGFLMDDSNGVIGRGDLAAFPTRVEAITLDRFLEDEPRVEVIKMDIEGAEALALQGMENFVRRHMPIVFSEFAPRALQKTSGVAPREYLDRLRSLGYALSVISRSDASVSVPQSNDEIMEAHDRSGSDHVDLVARPTG